MFKKGLDDRGQLSAEYLLLLVVILAILSLVTIPLVTQSIEASDDVSDVSAASNVVNSISNAVNVVYANGPGSKRTVNFYIPVNNMKLVTNGSLVSINVTLSGNTTKLVNATTSLPMGTATRTLSKGNHIITIWWDAGNPKASTSVT